MSTSKTSYMLRHTDSHDCIDSYLILSKLTCTAIIHIHRQILTFTSLSRKHPINPEIARISEIILRFHIRCNMVTSFYVQCNTCLAVNICLLYSMTSLSRHFWQMKIVKSFTSENNGNLQVWTNDGLLEGLEVKIQPELC